MHILICSATSFESAGLSSRWPAGTYASALTLDYVVTGVGPVLSGIHLMHAAAQRRPQLILNIGLAGALDRSLALGEVVHVVREEFGDLGVEERDGSFTSAFALGLVDPQASPFDNGYLHVPADPDSAFAKTVTAVTNSTVHGSATSIVALRAQTDAQIETMEGAAITYVGKQLDIPVVQLRAISNYVEPRDRASWKIEEALTNLTDALDQMLSALPGAQAARSAKQQLGL